MDSALFTARLYTTLRANALKIARRQEAGVDMEGEE